MKFGTYLKSVLEKRNIGVSQLAQMTGIKSKNTFYRLIEHYYSYDKTKEITDKILAVIEVSEEEKTKIYELMKMCHIKQHELEAFDLLKKLYKTPEHFTNEKFDSDNAIWKRSDCKEVHMFLGHTCTEYPALAAKEIFQNSSAENIKLDHFINFSRNEMNTAGALFSAITLCEFDGYMCYESETVDFTHLSAFVRLEHGWGAFVVSNDGLYSETELSEDFCKFMHDRFIKFEGKPLKNKKGKVTDFADIINEFSVSEVNNTFSFEGVFCFGDIPFDTMYSLLKDSDYLGLPPDSPYIQTLISAAKHRFDMRISSTATRSYVLSRSEIEKLLYSGKTIDHPDFLRKLTRSEIQGIIDYFKSIGDRFAYRFFKPEFHNSCVECGLTENRNIFIWSAKQGYNKNHFQIVISHPKALKLYGDFCEYFWNFCTLSQEESTKLFTDILDEFFNAPQE